MVSGFHQGPSAGVLWQIANLCLSFPENGPDGWTLSKLDTFSSSPATEAAPGCVGDMADTPRDAMLKPAPASRNEKPPADFGYVGIDSILEQMRRKAMKQGFEFNIMVVGESPAPTPSQTHVSPAIVGTVQ